MAAADRALYTAKAAGRNRVVLAAGPQDPGVLDSLEGAQPPTVGRPT